MDSTKIYTRLAYRASEQATLAYSTSFSAAITLLDKPIRRHIYAIYGLVRLADEVVDSFRPDDMKLQLDRLESDVFSAIETGFSANQLVHSFALTARTFHFDQAEVRAFFSSMRVDIDPVKQFSKEEFEAYIYGSAQVVGLMSLRVFCSENYAQFPQLKESASALGAAFQKINFLRDLRADNNLGRMYFPEVDFSHFNDRDKVQICGDIEQDIRLARRGLIELPRASRYGVLLSLYYYEALLKKMQHSSPKVLRQSRLRISNLYKSGLYLLVYCQKLLRM